VGLVSSQFSGPVTGSISIPSALSFEYEHIKNSKSSYTFENTIAIDPADTKTKYFALRFGSRYYFNSSNFSTQVNDKRGSFSIQPNLRFYGGWNLGIAQIVISSLGPVLDAVSTVVEYGGHVGSIYQINKDWGLEGKFSYNMGYGFSSVTVSSTTMQLAFGGAYYF
jgi:hypothetical protein